MILVVAAGLSPALVLGLFYLFTTLIPNLISNNASVVLLIPVATEAATELSADPFTFVFAVTFGASTAMLAPIGYHTNLMVYGPGGDKFTDFLRVGAPLQPLLAVVTTVGLLVFWGVWVSVRLRLPARIAPETPRRTRGGRPQLPGRRRCTSGQGG